MYRHVLSQACQPHCPCTCNLPANRLSLPFPSQTADRYLAESSSIFFHPPPSHPHRRFVRIVHHFVHYCPLIVCRSFVQPPISPSPAHIPLSSHTTPRPHLIVLPPTRLLHSWVPPATATHRHTHNLRTHALNLLYSSSTVAVVATSSQRPPRSPSQLPPPSSLPPLWSRPQLRRHRRRVRVASRFVATGVQARGRKRRSLRVPGTRRGSLRSGNLLARPIPTLPLETWSLQVCPSQMP